MSKLLFTIKHYVTNWGLRPGRLRSYTCEGYLRVYSKVVVIGYMDEKRKREHSFEIDREAFVSLFDEELKIFTEKRRRALESGFAYETPSTRGISQATDD